MKPFLEGRLGRNAARERYREWVLGELLRRFEERTVHDP
jgi:hypothetical protein